MQIYDTRLLLVFLLVFASTVYCYEEDATLSYGLRFNGENEQNRERQVAVIPRQIAQRPRGRGNVFLTSRAYYTANDTSTFQLYRTIEYYSGRRCSTNTGPKNNKKLPNYPCNECYKNVRSNQDALLCAVCTTWTHATCVGLTKETFKHYLAFSDVDWSCSWCNLPFASGNLSFKE